MFEFDQSEVESWPRKASEFMFHLIATMPNGFNADNFYDLCVGATMPPDVIRRLAGKLFREFQAAGYIVKTAQYTLSKRNGSSPLPVWIAAKKTNWIRISPFIRPEFQVVGFFQKRISSCHKYKSDTTLLFCRFEVFKKSINFDLINIDDISIW